MAVYHLTVFQRDGKLRLQETIEAHSDEEAKSLGEKRLREEGCLEMTHRLVSPKGKLLLFHS